MTLETFRERYGTAFYAFINSELGQAMLLALEKNDPGTRVVSLPPGEQTANSTLFLGQITGWRDCVITLDKQMIVRDEMARDPEPTYENEAGDGQGGASPDTHPADPPTPPPPVAAPKKRRNNNTSNKRK
jgi:hypothetical protein